MKFEARRSEVKVTMTLTEREAIWLRDYVQNPFCDPKDEPFSDAEMRHSLFDGIQEALDEGRNCATH